LKEEVKEWIGELSSGEVKEERLETSAIGREVEEASRGGVVFFVYSERVKVNGGGVLVAPDRVGPSRPGAA
jgi:hypothetical protein